MKTQIEKIIERLEDILSRVQMNATQRGLIAMELIVLQEIANNLE